MYDLVGNRTARSDLSLTGLGTWNEIEVLLLSCQSLAGGVVINRWSYRSSLLKKIRVADLLLYIKSHLLGLVCLWEVLLDSYGQSISQICSISLQVPIPLYPIFLRSDVFKCHLRIDSKEDWNTGWKITEAILYIFWRGTRRHQNHTFWNSTGLWQSVLGAGRGPMA